MALFTLTRIIHSRTLNAPQHSAVNALNIRLPSGSEKGKRLRVTPGLSPPTFGEQLVYSMCADVTGGGADFNDVWPKFSLTSWNDRNVFVAAFTVAAGNKRVSLTQRKWLNKNSLLLCSKPHSLHVPSHFTTAAPGQTNSRGFRRVMLLICNNIYLHI